MGTFRIKNAYNSGDIVTFLAGFAHMYRHLNVKVEIFQVLDFPAYYYDGAEHPVKDAEGNAVTMNELQWEMLKPLLLAQPYVESVNVWNGEVCDFNFDETRDRVRLRLPNGQIHSWYYFLFPQMQTDLSIPWITVPKGEMFGIEDKIIINRTERYQNPYIHYYFLKKYQSDLIFAGTEKEHTLFKEKWGLDIPRLIVKDFLELAGAIANCKFFIGNQSFCFHVADAIKKTRVLETCSQFPNTLPTGADGYAFLYQEALELYTEKLMK